MKHLFWILILLGGCTRSQTVTRQLPGIYAEVLSTRNGLVYYQRVAARPGVTPVVANSRARAWFNSSGRALGTVDEKPAPRKNDLLYQVSLPARPLPADSAGNVYTLPALRFGITVTNTADSTRVVATDFEVMDNDGKHRPLETYSVASEPMWVSMWLGDVDAAVTVMLDSLTTVISR